MLIMMIMTMSMMLCITWEGIVQNWAASPSKVDQDPKEETGEEEENKEEDKEENKERGKVEDGDWWRQELQERSETWEGGEWESTWWWWDMGWVGVVKS